jgi:hypothetical protein
MNRQEIYDAIDAERISQDNIWRTGSPVEDQYQYSAPHVLLLEENANKLRAIWYGLRNEGSLQDRFIKVAAIAVRALEEIKVTR